MKIGEKIFIAVLVVLILINIFYLLKRAEIIKIHPRLTNSQRALLDKFEIELSDGQYTLLIIFGVNDCASCMAEQKYWNQLNNKPNISVIAVGHHEFEDEFWKCIPNYGLNFKVIYDGEAAFKESFVGNEKTPYKILIKEYRLILQDGPNTDNISQEVSFRKILKEIS
ncbi:hypothetical protein JXI42_08455 [bacterium]|nr:hypothetical protein [bacterium]